VRHTHLYVRQGAPWFADLRAELLSFPAGRHDDQVDVGTDVGELARANATPTCSGPPIAIRSPSWPRAIVAGCRS
jgi:hypothetical protein